MLRTSLIAAALTISACGDTPDAPPVAARMNAGVQTAQIVVGAEGYEPTSVALQAGIPARLVFTRTSDDTCGTDIHAEALGVGRTPLPLGESVPIEFTPGAAGRFTFACGMDMMEGTIVVVRS
ncbi:MAG TPA: cupredoxin domain-containing protein [Rubricoccaceae bacterium]|jgi:Cu(I)/Ag(I) efflux system membrane fusion protein